MDALYEARKAAVLDMISCRAERTGEDREQALAAILDYVGPGSVEASWLRVIARDLGLLSEPE